MTLKTNEILESNYSANKEKIININEHFEGCRYGGRSIPIDECLCDCLEKQVFDLGMKQQRDNFYR